MFFDASFLSVTAGLRHRELLAEAATHRLAKLARRTRAEQRSARARPPVTQVSVPGDDDADRRCLVPR